MSLDNLEHHLNHLEVLEVDFDKLLAVVEVAVAVAVAIGSKLQTISITLH